MSLTRNVITGLLGVGIVSAGALALDNTVRDNAGEIVEAGELGVFSLRVGDCVRDLVGTEYEVSEGQGVPCSEAHNYEVFYETFFQDYSIFEINRVAEDVCETPFESYVGIPYEESRYYITFLTPTAQSYEEGDREVTCLLHNEFETVEFGSARNSRE